MALNFYRFGSEWRLAAPPDDVYRVLVELGDYPQWWPEVKQARLLEDHTYELVCRSFLPYELVFVTSEVRRDPVAGVLEGRLVGDLEGFSRWTMREDGNGHTVATFEEEVVANKRVLRQLALVARRAFRANHALMMRHGREGLNAYLPRLGEAAPS
jgi:hypothetical protein